MGLTETCQGTPGPGAEKWELFKELQALAAGRLCRPGQQAKCRAEHGSFAAWACEACAEYLRPETVSPWTWHLILLHRLKQARYPFRANDLDLETWLLLGLVEDALTKDTGGGNGQEQRQ